MKDIVLEFDKREVSEEEIREHINYYATKAKEGMNLYSLGKKKEALELLRGIRTCLKQEYKYYHKVSVGEFTRKNNLYGTYAKGVTQAWVKQINPNSYQTLRSNLYDVYSYIRCY